MLFEVEVLSARQMREEFGIDIEELAKGRLISAMVRRSRRPLPSRQQRIWFCQFAVKRFGQLFVTDKHFQRARKSLRGFGAWYNFLGLWLSNWARDFLEDPDSFQARGNLLLETERKKLKQNHHSKGSLCG